MDETERQKLMLEYLPLVHRIARRIAHTLPPSVHWEELVTPGFFGLHDALNKYRPEKGSLKVYAGVRIRGAIKDELRNMDWSPRLNRKRKTELEKIRTAKEQELMRHVPDNELGIYFEPLRWVQIEKWTRRLFTHDPDPHKLLEEKERFALYRKAVEELPERERYVVTVYYETGTFFKDIGKQLGVTESAVSMIHTAARERLKASLLKLA